MGSKLKNWIAISIIPQIFFVKWVGSYPDIIEKYYSEGIFPWISKFFRILYGWIPFSVGDILYFVLALLAIRYIVVNWWEIRNYPLRFLRNMLFVLSITYFSFHLLWGMNYYRQPIAKKFALSETHSDQDLLDLVEILIDKTNQLQFDITKDTAMAVEIPYSKKEIFAKTLESYDQLEKAYPFIPYRNPSIKKSIFSTALSYMGYGGYLNPFTHEAQVNGRLPNFWFPVVSGHEIGHQVGYSAENETNFIGYLATLHNPDIYFQYSSHAYALAYCLSNIRINDEETFNAFYETLNPGIRKNFKEISDFWESFANPMEPFFKLVFNSFLKANNQAAGIKSYDAVVSLMVIYHKEHSL